MCARHGGGSVAQSLLRTSFDVGNTVGKANFRNEKGLKPHGLSPCFCSGGDDEELVEDPALRGTRDLPDAPNGRAGTF